MGVETARPGFADARLMTERQGLLLALRLIFQTIFSSLKIMGKFDGAILSTSPVLGQLFFSIFSSS